MCVVVMRCLRIIFRISVREKRQHMEVRVGMGEWWLLRVFLVCKPDGGMWAVGGHKLRWNDLVSKDLKLWGLVN